MCVRFPSFRAEAKHATYLACGQSRRHVKHAVFDMDMVREQQTFDFHAAASLRADEVISGGIE
eukprot:15431567-Alexandrium_andersonii.AAC.1